MASPLIAVLSSWSLEAGPLLGCLVASALYLRGWRGLQGFAPSRVPGWRMACFLAGLVTVYAAVASPLDACAEFSLQAHMLQHVLLSLVAPPLLWLGAPWVPILRGLPAAVRKQGLGPFLAWPALRACFHKLAHPAVSGFLFVLTTWLWHAPPLYELALGSTFWHDIEHLCFLLAGLLFWFEVVRPWPSRNPRSRVVLLPYLALAGIQNGVLAAIFSFSDRVLYKSYAEVPRLWGGSALADQAAAGALLWLAGALVGLVAVVGVVHVLLQGEPSSKPRGPRWVPSTRSSSQRPGWVPGTSARVGQRALQVVLALLACAIVVDGLVGPQLSPLNLAGVVPWTYARGLTVIALLIAGNLFCSVCPFTLPRGLARRILRGRFAWPEALRNKWLSLGLWLAFLFAYEAFALWDSPYWTAWIVLGYFVTAFAVDVFFEKASFCKYVCPVGQFGFLSAALSPLEVKVRDPGICASCQSHDCIRGNATQRGCELDLFAPAKQGNLDCTFCLDCTRACPHENVALTPAFPGLALARDPNRSGLGRLSRRPDLSALAGVIVFGAFANAAAMVAPVAGLGLVALPYGRGLAVVLGIGLAWLLCIGVGRLSAWSGELAGPPAESRRLMLFALLPLGFSMWLSHFAFHLFTAGGALRAVVSRYEVLSGMARVETGTKLVMAVGGGTRSQLDFELVVLGGGLLLCLAWLWRVASARAVRPIGYVLPWALVALALYGSGVWIVFQPMEMRGMS